jgi:hypothetical protein
MEYCLSKIYRSPSYNISLGLVIFGQISAGMAEQLRGEEGNGDKRKNLSSVLKAQNFVGV